MQRTERIIIKVYPMNEQANPYVITCEHAAPCSTAAVIAKDIEYLLRSEFIAEGVRNISRVR